MQAKFIECANEIPMTMSVVQLEEYFNEYRYYNVKQCMTVKELEMLAEKDSTLSTFEVISTPLTKIFLDLENIPTDKDIMYEKIIEDFMEYVGLKIDLVPYVVTINTHSHHPGLSYHVIISAITTMDNIRNMVNNFINDHKQYADYIDNKIYTRNRLFRLPLQHGIKSKGRNNNISPDYNIHDDMHHILAIKNFDNEDNYHLFVIQYISHPRYIYYHRLWKKIYVETEKTQSGDFNYGMKAYNALCWMFRSIKSWFN